MSVRDDGRTREPETPPAGPADLKKFRPTTGVTTPSLRSANRVHERLLRLQEQLKRVRATERVLAEQVAHLDEVAADAETRKLVSQTPLADREWREARTDRDRHRALLDDARRESDELLAERDRLLEQLQELDTTRRPEGSDQ